MQTAEVLPTPAAWRHFVDRLLLFAGATMLATAVIFFFAFNWQALDRLAKFALAEIPIVAGLVFLWRIGVDRLAGKATLLALSLLTGALLALVGQTYQTGADTFELFAVWAVAILPWTLIARFPALWILWLIVLNLATLLYATTFRPFALLFGPSDETMWALFVVNTVALAGWESLARARLPWLRARWATRLIATASVGFLTAAVLPAIFDPLHRNLASIPVWLVSLAAAYAVYRRRLKDVYVLALGVLSAIVVISAVLTKVFGSAEGAAFLLIGLLVIGLSAAGGYWLKQVAQEDEP
jgi:Predicted membrane protein